MPKQALTVINLGAELERAIQEVSEHFNGTMIFDEQSGQWKPLLKNRQVKEPAPTLLEDPTENRFGKMRSDGSDTQYASAVLVAPKSGSQRFKVLLAIVKAYPGGLTDQELGNILDLAGDTIRPRRGELVDTGWVMDSGRRKQIEGTTREAIVWRLTPAAVKLAKGD